MTDDELLALRRDVDRLLDRQAILDVVARHARGCDRHDVDLLCSAYHPDAVDEHGSTVTSGPDYPEWANATHAASSQAHLHHVTTHTCELDGDTAHTESYVMVTLLGPDAKYATVMCGRYLDRLERRDGEWRIAVRRSTVELAFSADARLLGSPFFTEQHYLRGTRGDDDLSYRRPLQLDDDAPARW